MTEAELRAQVQAITTKMEDILISKNKDYSGCNLDNISKFGEFGVLVRVSDKIGRLESLVGRQQEVQIKDESIEDTWLDIANYCVLALLIRGAKK